MLSDKDQANAEEVLYAIKHIEEYVKGIPTIEDLKNKVMTYDAVMMNFILIGEACKRLPENLKDANPHIDWKGINGYRNFIAHDYFGVDEKLAWSAIKIELPQLKTDFEKLLGK